MGAATITTTADGLRAAADLLTAHPDLPTPCVFAYDSSGTIEVSWHLLSGDDNSTEAQKAAARAIITAIGGTWDKNPYGERFDFERKYGPLDLQIYATRDAMCERVVVGSETVTVPAVQAQPERTEEREMVEWRCESLLRPDEAAETTVAS